MLEQQGVLPARGEGFRDWRTWMPYAAVAWSLLYAALGIYWAVSGRGFPYTPVSVPDTIGPLIGRFGPAVAWSVVVLAGLPAAAMGAAMLRGVRIPTFRILFIAAGALLAGVLLLLMTGMTLLVLLGYVPYAVVGLLTGAKIGKIYLDALAQWTVMHQLLCFTGGFLWLAATVSYGRRTRDACLYCGRPNGPEGWKSPASAARWGRIAVYVASFVPVFYALTRYAWALGFPLGITDELLRKGQQRGMWISGLSLATFGLVGVVLMFGLVQRWGEVFPRWMIGLAGRRVPIALAIVPASLVSALLTVGGLAMWSSYSQLTVKSAGAGAQAMGITMLGPVLLFPVWGAALALAALAYYYRRRPPCPICRRAAP